MEWLANALRQHPELALFLTLAIGYALGRIRFGSVQLGAVQRCSHHRRAHRATRHRHLARSEVLLGVCAGAGTSAPGLAAVQEIAKSKIPTLGYGVTYAIGNVLLALWGSVMVVLMAR